MGSREVGDAPISDTPMCNTLVGVDKSGRYTPGSLFSSPLVYSALVIVIIFIFVSYDQGIYEYFSGNHMVYSDIDGRHYSVVGGFDNPTKAAGKMADVNKFIIDYLRFLKKKFLIDQDGNAKERAFVTRVLNRYNPDVMVENWPKPGEDTSYVISKGDKFGLCLRDKKTHEFHNFNLIQFVVIHEMTHMGTTTYGHNYEFWSWMKFMLTQAKESGLYTPIDYKKNRHVYCGMQVYSNPYYQDYDWNKSI